MKIVLASDHGGFELLREIASQLDDLGIDYDNIGCDCETSVDYPDYGIPAAEKVANGSYDRGILICGTGIGMSIAANKVKGIRAALVHDVYTARVTREHNDSNILVMGARVIGVDLAKEIVKTWLAGEFQGGRHANRIGKVAAYEEK
ncbi:Putative sugar phosphate isomerase YwlF [Paraliobacillus sp. PM-2]|uniref:ribose 5-phosphate isomerase B n=1 Tax=Paraliobacillus sp. PM-2 TaxID=1462524 RepID=UPI00061BA002|nr:ribose 5-phosphate isomerase B [Paraliobacillus sp. PM-2]CQR46156.1 Putative sugar phosphate isomerase YwlF [Paraliobacillus sp. PM-2]